MKEIPNKPKIRCAIYTRKSREEGLEQSFNSLDAQRLAAENYIASQIGEGWVLNPDFYDDGAYSGGNTDRPAFKQLLTDIEEKKVDCVVVYKADRLSRSLFDFAKILEFFDKHGVSFTSVTESFSTATASGRLMLGMIMSFAQYERELASERVRDKIDASKKLGMWMGGTIPLGYDSVDSKLQINEEEAKIVSSIFDLFIKNKSTLETARELVDFGFKTKSFTSKKGRFQIGKKFNKQHVRRILEHPIYAGMVVHRGVTYQGQHKEIVSKDKWDKANEILRANPSCGVDKSLTRVTQTPVLKGVISCGCCRSKMVPTYTCKKGKRYRYYLCVSKAVGNNDSCEIARISANEIEKLVIRQVLITLKKPEFIASTIKAAAIHTSETEVINYFKNVEKVWEELFPLEQTRIINLLIQSVELHPEGLKIRVFKDGIKTLANELLDEPSENNTNNLCQEVVEMFVPAEIKKRGGTAMIIVPQKVDPEDIQKDFDDTLIKSIARAYKWKVMLEEQKVSSLADIARDEKLGSAFVSKIFNLNFVSPRIVERILDGTQPRSLKLQDIVTGEIPDSWDEQEVRWGFK